MDSQHGRDRQAADHLGTLQPYVVRVCSGANCGVRFPVAEASDAYETCHLCGAATDIVARIERHDGTSDGRPVLPVVGLLDNIRSAMNVGTIFRTADGVGISHLHLGGITPAGDHPKVIKTALGSEATVAWSHHPNLATHAETLVASGTTLWAMEATPTSVPLADIELGDVAPVGPPLGIVVGNEIAGVDPDILRLCERHVHLPMRGVKNSLNVGVAFGVLAYHLDALALGG